MRRRRPLALPADVSVERGRRALIACAPLAVIKARCVGHLPDLSDTSPVSLRPYTARKTGIHLSNVPQSIEDRQVPLNDGQGHLGDRLLLRIASSPQVRAIERQQFSVTGDLAFHVHGVKGRTCRQALKPREDRRMIGSQRCGTRRCAECGRYLDLLGNSAFAKFMMSGLRVFESANLLLRIANSPPTRSWVRKSTTGASRASATRPANP